MPSELSVVSSSTSLMDPRKRVLADDPMEPQTLAELAHFAEEVSRTDFAAGFKDKPVDCFIAMRYGRDLGLSSLQSVQGIAVINGKPSVYGDTFWALILSHPEFEDVIESVTMEGAKVTLKRRGKTPKEAEFTQADAKTAGLWMKMGGKEKDKPTPWVTDPKSMLLWRARHRASSLFADALRGILPREVAQDFIEGEVVSQRAQPIAFASVDAGTKREEPAEQRREEAKQEAAPAADQKVEEPAGPALITKAQAAEFNGARKASGWSTVETNAYLKDVLKVERMGELHADRFEEAMTWARTKKPDPVPTMEQSGDQRFCLKTWDKLGSNQDERIADTAKHTDVDGVTDWSTLGMELHARLEEGQQ